MNPKFYFDVHVRRAIADGLRLRGVDVLTAQEDGTSELSDSELLDRATELKRILVTHDDDFLKEAAKRRRSGAFFNGIVYAHQLNISIFQCISDLELISQATQIDEWPNQVVYLPLK